MEEVKKLAFNLGNPFENMSEEEIAERDKWIEQKEKEDELKQRQFVFERCGIGEDYKRCTMSNFEVNLPKQKEMKDKARKFYRDITGGEVWNMLLFGSAGQGKTRLAVSLLHYFCTTVKRVVYGLNEYYSVEYITSKDLVDMLNRTKSFSCTRSFEQIVRDMVNSDILVIDEVGKATDRYEYECLFSVLDKRYQNGKPTILATNLTFEQVKENFSDYGMSRLNYHNHLMLVDTSGLPDLRQR